MDLRNYYKYNFIVCVPKCHLILPMYREVHRKVITIQFSVAQLLGTEALCIIRSESYSPILPLNPLFFPLHVSSSIYSLLQTPHNSVYSSALPRTIPFIPYPNPSPSLPPCV